MNDHPAPGASSAGDLETAVRRMARIGYCYAPTFSPDGLHLAFIADLSGLPQVWTVAGDGGWPRLVTGLDDQITGVKWSPGGQWLAFSLAPGGGLNSQVHLCRPDGSDMRRLSEGGQTNNWLGRWSPDGRLAVASNRRDPQAMDAYLVDPAGNTWTLVGRNQGIGEVADVSRDGRYAILYRMLSRSDDDLYLLDLESGAETLLTPHEGPGHFGNGRFAPGGRSLYLLSNHGRENLAFGRIRLDQDGTPGPIEHLAARDDAELQAFDVSADGRLAALVWNVAGRNELAFYDLQSGQHAPGPTLPGEIVHELTFAPTGARLALVISGAAAPLDIHLYDHADGRLWQLTRSPHPAVALDQLVRPELVHFQAHDGLPLSGWLYRPQGFAAPGPTVLNFHGGPESQETPRFNSTYQALLSQGIAIFAPNVRGSSGFGKTFVNLDNGALRTNAVQDIQSCVDYAVNQGIAAPGRIGIMGGSYGGYMTMAGLTTFPETFAAGATICGVVNFETFFANTEPWMAAISTVEYGDPVTEADLLRALSPIHKIDRVQAATLVLHGANDTNVPVVEADQVVETLRERGVPVHYVLFPDEGHGFTKTANRITAAVEITRWFATHLTPGSSA
jgi:dipeptidyl aminopeptidase/acylaminoacyl peptidase